MDKAAEDTNFDFPILGFFFGRVGRREEKQTSTSIQEYFTNSISHKNW